MLAGVLLAQVAAAAPPPDTALRAALRAARHVVTLDAAGRLGGAGGELLLRETSAAQFVLIGEEHGVAEVPKLVAAVVRHGAAQGYRYLGIEVGAQMAGELNRMALSPDITKRVDQFTRDRPPGIPFFTLREEAELLGAAVAAMGNRPDVLWGLDYDVVADRWLLPRLRESAATPAARRALDDAIALSDTLLARALREKNPGLAMMFGGTDSVFTALRAALAPAEASEADEALALMEETLAINQLFVSRRGLESNERRGRLMKRQLARALTGARMEGALPKAVFKFGASHMMRGRTLTDIFDVGNTLAELADLEGRSSFHVFVLGGPGSQHAQMDPTVFKYKPAPGDLDRIPALAALAAESPPGQWTLFDVRQLRARARSLTTDSAVLQILFGFDVVVILGGSTPSTSLGS
jgi:hypothetical protein